MLAEEKTREKQRKEEEIKKKKEEEIIKKQKEEERRKREEERKEKERLAKKREAEIKAVEEKKAAEAAKKAAEAEKLRIQLEKKAAREKRLKSFHHFGGETAAQVYRIVAVVILDLVVFISKMAQSQSGFGKFGWFVLMVVLGVAGSFVMIFITVETQEISENKTFHSVLTLVILILSITLSVRSAIQINIVKPTAAFESQYQSAIDDINNGEYGNAMKTLKKMLEKDREQRAEHLMSDCQIQMVKYLDIGTKISLGEVYWTILDRNDSEVLVLSDWQKNETGRAFVCWDWDDNMFLRYSLNHSFYDEYIPEWLKSAIIVTEGPSDNRINEKIFILSEDEIDKYCNQIGSQDNYWYVRENDTDNYYVVHRGRVEVEDQAYSDTGYRAACWIDTSQLKLTVLN